MTTITPHDLADLLAAGETPPLVDVRPSEEVAAWTLSGDGVAVDAVTTSEITADPDAARGSVPDGAILVCNRGIAATTAADALRGAGADVRVLDGGLRGWLKVLRPHTVPLGIDGVEVLQIQRPGRGCLSYMVIADGEALVVDPAPEVDPYLSLAAERSARITTVFDTHLHADHLSGARALAAAAGARHVVPEGTVARGVDFTPTATVRDGDVLPVGPERVEVVALPGHTTDMTGLVVGGRVILTGDSLFADGIARPDLEVGDLQRSRAMARTLHATLRDRVLSRSGDTLVLGGHAHPGFRRDAVAPTLDEVRAAVGELALTDPDAFADEVLAAMPPRPANYEAVIEVNAGRAPFDPDLEAGGNSCSTR